MSEYIIKNEHEEKLIERRRNELKRILKEKIISDFKYFNEDLKIIENYFKENNIEFKYGSGLLKLKQPDNIDYNEFKKSFFVKIVEDFNREMLKLNKSCCNRDSFKILDFERIRCDLNRDRYCSRSINLYFDRTIDKIYTFKYLEDLIDYNINDVKIEDLENLEFPNLKQIISEINMKNQIKKEYKSLNEYFCDLLKYFKLK